MQIGEVSTRTGLSVKTIRHYDEVRVVVPSARSAGGFRLYTPADVARLVAIRRMKPLGFTLDEMRDLLAARDALEAASTTDGERAAATRYLASCHRRAQRACATLETQLGYARELTEQLAQYERPESRSGCADGANFLQSSAADAV